MAKNGTKIDELFISLGMDLSELDADFITADKTVAEGIQALNRKQTQAKLRMEIDTSAFAGAENSAEALQRKEKSLNEQLTLQKQKILLVNAAYQESIAKKGEDNAATQRQLTALLREQKIQAQLEKQIRETNTARTAGGEIKSLGSASNALSAATGGFAALQTKMAAVMAIALTGAGLFNIVDSAAKAGNAVFSLSNKLHISTTEAAGLNRVLVMGGTDSQSFISTMIRLDRAVGTAGKSGNATTNSLKAFGISLTDAQGDILPMNKQLEQLAKGYDNAAKAGQEEAFASEVLGARGQALVPVLEQYNELMEASSRVQTTGLLNPKEAHELSIELKVLQMDSKNLADALGAALIPIANEVAPVIEDAMGYALKAIKENKDAIAEDSKEVAGLVMEVGKLAGAIGTTLLNALDTVARKTGILKEMKEDLQGASDHPYIETALVATGVIGGAMVGGPVGAAMGGTTGLSAATALSEVAGWTAVARARNEAAEADKEAEKQQKADAEAAAKEAMEASRKAIAESKENLKADEEIEAAKYHASHTTLENQLFDIEEKRKANKDAGMDEAKAWELAELQKAAAIKKANEIIAAANEALANQLYSATHSQLNAALHNIDTQTAAEVKKGADTALATQLAEAQKSRIMEDFENNTMSKINSIYKSALQNRLDDIEREKQAYKQKGVAEIEATKWAEHEKRKAQQDEALSALKENRKYLEVIKSAMNGTMPMGVTTTPGGTKIYDMYQNQTDAMAAAKQKVLQMMRTDAGIRPDDMMTPELISMYSSAMKFAKDNLVPGLEMDPEAATKNNYGVNAINASIDIVNPAIEQIEQVKQEAASLTQSFAITGQSAADAFFAPFHEQMANLMNNGLASQSGSAQSTQTTTINPVIHVNINNPQVQSNLDITSLADQVADKITPAIKQAIGGDQNSY